MLDHDVVVLGGGTAGVHVAGELARAGRSVALVERRRLAADSPDLACLPARSLLHSARRGEPWEAAVARRTELVRRGRTARGPLTTPQTMRTGALAEAGVTVVHGTGRVAGAGTVEVVADGGGSTEYGYRDLVLCTGAEPVRPELPGLADVPVWTGDEALGRPDLPRRLVVLGGGPAGCELAQLYAAYGSQVAVVAETDRLLATEARFVGRVVGDALRRMGVDLRLGTCPERIDRTGVGFRLRLRDGGAIDADRVLIATDRRPCLDDLGLEALGIDPAPGLTVDASCRVASRVWAAGDVTGVLPGPHTAVYQASVVAANILGRRRRADYSAIPRVVHTTPSAYVVGVSPSPDELVTAGVDLSEIARTRLEEDARGRVELYADRSSGLLAGAAAVGPYAEEWMSEVALAIKAKIPLRTLGEVVRAYPTYGEAIGAAVHDLAERLSGNDGYNAYSAGRGTS